MRQNYKHQPDYNNVIHLFTGKSLTEQATQAIIQLCPETSGIRMLYSAPANPERLIAVPLLCWAQRLDGNVVGLVPWIDEVTDCTTIDNKLQVNWEGYYDESTDTIFFDAPEMIVAQLNAVMPFLEPPAEDKLKVGTLEHEAVTDEQDDLEEDDNEVNVIQEIPDIVGTHALLVNHDQQSLTLTPVVSWILDDHGVLHGMLVDEECAEQIPVIPGDDCLYTASGNSSFRCFFQRDIAEQIRVRNPETMAAIEQLLSS